MIAAIALTAFSVIMLFRAMMILVGLYKTPILRTFEEYGPDERPYLPGLPVLMWSGVIILSASIWMNRFGGLEFTMNCLGLLMLLTGGIGYNYYDKTARYHLMLLKVPRWYHELLGRTTRYERRRIAYMWLHLPARMRLTYNSSDKQFFVWADFVIMGTIREEELKPGDEEALYTGR
jgi:hypothetical protein